MLSKQGMLYGLGCVTGGSLGLVGGMWWNEGKKEEKIILKGAVEMKGDLVKWGLPSDEHINVVEQSFVTSDNWRTRCPNWVLEHLTPESLKGSVGREKSSFKAAKEVPEAFRSSLTDYKEARSHGDYVRGHMVPAADMKLNQDVMDATFILNHNVVPQDSGSNTGSWFHLENLVRVVAKKHPHTWVASGPIWKPEQHSENGAKEVTYKVVGPHDVAVPTHLFKTIVIETSRGYHYSASFIVPNSPSNDAPIAYKVPTSEVESLTGLQLFENLSRPSDMCSLEKCTVKAKSFTNHKKEE
eukprot:TRINITY_DN37172_c0_g1_i1.p1 TRINITY_DN37172_c0_g1~~TRINITY_DN37172_c0_g1_i1.p1  ORF type:complete len:298 (+),score=73.07 TRINITY_DN37172_c0_g1_i1:37-930(+)